MATHAVSMQSKLGADHTDGLLARIARDIASLNHWLSGPPMAELERKNRVLAETEPLRHLGAQGF
jgi:hypothetical protein